jgi:hypothetical protein
MKMWQNAMDFFKYFEETYNPELEKNKERELKSLLAQFELESDEDWSRFKRKLRNE